MTISAAYEYKSEVMDWFDKKIESADDNQEFKMLFVKDNGKWIIDEID